jgi:tubulin polyglutamylase TTLL6/13
MQQQESKYNEDNDENFADLGPSSDSEGEGQELESSKAETEEETPSTNKAHGIKDSKKDDKKGKSSGDKENIKKKETQKPRIVFNISDTKYDVVKYVGRRLYKWKLTHDPETEWDVCWTDNAVQVEQLAKMQPFQKINHFPGMYSLARKNHLGRNLMRMKKQFPDNFKFFPPTWLLPAEYSDFKSQFNKKKAKTFIVKPEASCQGRGIFLTRSYESINPTDHFVAQRYLHKPYLIDDLKFDMRIYVLLAGCDPLRIYLFEEGLARFATETYVSPTPDNLDKVCMHLTNYAINKDNPNFVFNESEDQDDVGHKRSLTSVMKLLEDEGHDVQKLMKEIKKIIIKTFCSVQPILAHSYRSCQPEEPYNNMCFELLGFDIMLDHKLKPWLIEVNHTPSFTTDTPLDRTIKKNVIKDSLKIMNISLENRFKYKNKKRIELQKRVLTGKKIKMTPEEKRALFEQAQKERDDYEAKNLGGFTKIYPFDNEESWEDYGEYINAAHKWWEEWTGTTVKKNVKKVDKTAPAPMSFSLGNAANAVNNRAKDIQSIYSQKLKAGTSSAAKPASQQGARARPGNNSISTAGSTTNSNSVTEADVKKFGSRVEESKGDAKDGSTTGERTHSAKKTSMEQLDVNGMHDDEREMLSKEFKERNNLVPEDDQGPGYSTVNTQKQLIDESAELDSMKKIRQASLTKLSMDSSATKSVKNNSFRIRGQATQNGPPGAIKNVSYSSSKSDARGLGNPSTDEERYAFSKKFAHYLDMEKYQDVFGGNPNEIIMTTTGLPSSSHNISSKKVNSKALVGLDTNTMYGDNPGMLGMHYYMMGGDDNTNNINKMLPPSIPGFIRPNGKKQHTVATQEEMNIKYSKKTTSPAGYFKGSQQGNYLQPKLMEFSLQSQIRADDVEAKGGVWKRIRPNN